MKDKSNIQLIILGAGKASRMGRIKQLLPWKNSTLIENAITQGINSNVTHVNVVLGAYAETIRLKIKHFNSVSVIGNPNWEMGMLSSLQTGLKSLPAETDAVIVTLVDQPAVSSGYINQIIEDFQNHDKSIIATQYKLNYGVPVLFQKNQFQSLLNLSEESGGAQKYIQNNLAQTLGIVPNFEIFDIDTNEDYEKYFTKYGKIDKSH